MWRSRNIFHNRPTSLFRTQYLWEARFRGVRRQLIRRAKRMGVTAEADVFRAV